VATTAEALGTDARILDAAFRAVATHGLARLTMDDVARLAGLSRQTVYRYFPSKDALIVALVEREEETFIDGVRAANEKWDRLEDVMREAILFSLQTARDHPLLDRLLASEPEVLLPYLTTRGSGLVTKARAVIEELAGGRADVRPELVHRAADLAVRAIVSYVITPSDDDPRAIAAETARVLARALEDGGRKGR
jgi:AcrR family transcriptional regulator